MQWSWCLRFGFFVNIVWVQKIIKVGDSLAVVVPADLRRTLEINKGDFVVLVLGSNDTLYISKITPDTAKSLLEKDIHYEN